MLHALVLAAQTLPIRYRTENARAKQTITLRLESPVVDGFGLGYLAMGPAPDFLRRGQADADGVEVSNRICHVKGARTVQGGPPLPAVVRRRYATPEISVEFPVSSFLSGPDSLHVSGLPNGEQLPAGSLFTNLFPKFATLSVLSDLTES